MERPVVLIALASLAAEGTPRMALALCREWRARNIRPIVVVLNSEPADLLQEFKSQGFGVIVLGIPRTGLRRYAIMAWHFYVLARRYRASALLSMPLGWHSFMALGARIGGVRRVVAHVGNYPNTATGMSFRKLRFLVTLGRPFTDRLVCCSRYVQRGAIEHFRVPARETATIYNGVDARTFINERCAQRQRRGPFVVGMVARLERHKDHDTLIHAARILKNRGRNIVVNIIGDGSQRDRLRRLIERKGLSDVVRLFGMRRDIPAVLAELDLFAFSTTPDEGFGIALVEAMLAEVPVVASDVGACREVLDDGQLGVLVPASNQVALADAIDAVILAPSDARMRAAHARAKAIEMYSAHAMARDYGEVLGIQSSGEIKSAAAPAPELAA